MHTKTKPFYKIWYFIVLLLIITKVPSLSIAQTYPIKNYSIADGLSAMQCSNLFKDSRGFIWVTTKNGISRFDGENFKNFFEEDGLHDSKLNYGITEDENGTIMILNGKYIFEYDGQKFFKIPLPVDIKELDTQAFKKIKNRFFIRCKTRQDNGALCTIFEYFPKERKLTKLLFPKIQEGWFCPQFFDGEKWYGFKASLGKNNNKNIYSYSKTGFEKIVNTINNSGNVYYKTKYNDLIISYTDESGSTVFKRKLANNTLDNWIKIDRENYPVVEKPHDKEMIFEWSGNLYLIDAHSTQLQLVNNEYGSFSAIMAGDTPNDYWIATEKGLLHFINNGFRFFEEKQVPYTWSIAEGTGQNKWFCGYGVPLKFFDGKTIIDEKRHFKLFPFIAAENGGLASRPSANKYYYQGFLDDYGKTWFPNENGLFNFDGKNFNLVNKYGAWFLLYDRAQQKVFQGNSTGFIVTDIKKTKESFLLKAGIDLLPYRNYMYAFKDSKQRYWLGGWGGLNRFEDFEAVKKGKSVEFSRANGTIDFKGFVTMVEDSSRTIWAGTTSGLRYFDEKSRKFIRVLPNFIKDIVFMMGLLSKNKLLLGNEKGIYVFDITKLKKGNEALLKTYNKNNGFVGLEAGQNGFQRDKFGKIWITSGTVLSVLDETKLDFENQALTPYFESVNNHSIKYGKANDIIEKENNLKIKVGSVGSNRPFKNQYAYFIEGYSTQWSTWQESNLIFISNLPNGLNIIKIKALTEGIDFKDLPTAQLGITINSNFWESPNFYKYAFGLILLLLAIVVYSLIKNRIKDQKVKEKESLINKLKVQTLQAQLNPHFLFNSLGSLQNLILKKETALANHSLTKLSSLMRSYLESSILANNPRIRKNEISLSQKIDLLNSYIELESIQHHDKFNYKIEFAADLPLDSIKFPPLIIQPFVENAIKHGLVHKKEKGNLHIKFEYSDEVLKCTITDDGIGREAAAEIKRKSEHSYKSYGTQLVYERVKLLNEADYNIHIQTIDPPEGGTIVIIKIQQKYED